MGWIRSSLLLLVGVGVLLLSGCASESDRFALRSLAKSDTDLVADLHRRHTLLLLEQLNSKLYKRNPVELLKRPGSSIESRWQSLIQASSSAGAIPEVGGSRGIEAMRLAFNESYTGDRVFALMAGLTSMLDEAYGYKQEFFWLDSIDQQKLYISARNIEIMVWLLRSRLAADGRPLLLADSINDEAVNLSFERLFGKLIAHQDMLAAIMAYKTQRAINTVAQGLFSSTFIPF